jgi:hypothetical protein
MLTFSSTINYIKEQRKIHAKHARESEMKQYLGVLFSCTFQEQKQAQIFLN